LQKASESSTEHTFTVVAQCGVMIFIPLITRDTNASYLRKPPFSAFRRENRQLTKSTVIAEKSYNENKNLGTGWRILQEDNDA